MICRILPGRLRPTFLTACLSLIATTCAKAVEDPFAAGVRPTEPLTPEEQAKAFELPPGFQIQLFAAEPDIQKPMNLAFDARGRLWVTDSTEYPFAAPPDRKPRDTLRILEDTDGDGRADKVTVFADELNIPIGVYPYRNGAIVYSIPNIYFMEDLDGDDKADRRTVLYGPFDYHRDTHGMQNAFRRGFDGWLYANHGFNNDSHVKGADGHEVHMNSGNTYRVRLDGGRIEQIGHGQVNPFGMTFDPLGQIFNSDCHTKPITLILRDGWYESFGKPHNGLGFVPPVMTHDHGSTAIAGTAQYTGLNFPEEYRGNLFSGNVMTSRVNRDSLKYIGSTAKATEEPDFISTKDPWFRPVDLQSGPDGALYIADFYNKIIGHYEVPITHPERDRHRGRIWRVTYVGTDAEPAKSDPVPNLRSFSTYGLIKALEHPNLGLRMRATDEITDRVGPHAVPFLQKAIDKTTVSTVRVHGLWALQRLGGLDEARLLAGASDTDPVVRGHAMQILANRPLWSSAMRDAALAGLEDSDPLVRRFAVEAFGDHPNPADVPLLVGLWQSTPPGDEYLRYVIRIALWKNFQQRGVLANWMKTPHERPVDDLVADLCLALPNEDAAGFLLSYLKNYEVAPELMGKYLKHAARHLPVIEDVDALASLAQEGVASDIDLQNDLLFSVRDGLRQRGKPDTDAVRQWGATLAARLLSSVDPGSLSWSDGLGNGQPIVWGLETRRSADGDSGTLFLSSLPANEWHIGSVRSKSFTIPSSLSFFVCGHLGHPEKPAIEKSFVRLRLSDSDEIIAESLPPRNDVAQRVTWDLKDHAGQQGYIEVFDGLDGTAYAWIAVSRFDPPVVSVPSLNPTIVSKRQQSASAIAEAFQLSGLAEGLKSVALASFGDPAARGAAARALVSFGPRDLSRALAAVVAEPAVTGSLRDSICQALSGGDVTAEDAVLLQVMKEAPERAQVILAETLAATKPGAEKLLALVQQGAVSPRLLQNASLRQRILSAAPMDAESRIEALTKDLPTADAAIAALIAKRREEYPKRNVNYERGQEVFKKNCASCHQIKGQGAVVGPQLDGIGNRGLERICEDVLDPNRNVDPKFFATVYAMADGQILTGLFRRQEGSTIIIADNKGKEISLDEADIDEQKTVKLSLMPDNVASSLPENEFFDLMNYLASQRQTAAEGSQGTTP